MRFLQWAAPAILLCGVAAPLDSLRAQQGSNAPQETSSADAQESPSQTQPAKAPDPLLSPRSMIREFLLAAGESEQKPERIKDAVRCLDLSSLKQADPEQAEKQAPLLAKQLEGIIDALLNIYGKSLDEIPETTDASAVVFPAEGDLQLTLTRSQDNLWRFSAETVAAIPEHLESVKKKEERETPPVEIAEDVPKEFRSARATMRTFLEAITAGDATTAATCLNLSHIPATTRAEIGTDLAKRLLYVMDRIKVAVYLEISDRSDAEPYTWYFGEHGRIELAPSQESDRKGYWLFSTATVKSIEPMFEAFGDKARLVELEEISFARNPKQWLLEKIPTTWKGGFLGIQLWQWTGIAVTLGLGYAAYRIGFLVLCALARPIGRSEHIQLSATWISSSMRPLAILIMVVFWWVGLRLLLIPPAIQAIIWPALKFVMTIVGVWGSYRLIDLVSDFFSARARRTRSRLDDVLVPLMRKTAKIVVVVVGGIFIFNALGMEASTVNKLFAGLGLGGLAFALAAQDSLKNFFGSITVVLDRPFQVGDWVKIGDVEGTVESVGLRSSRIRTFYNSEITVPNSEIMNTVVDNMGRRQFRRIRIMIAVTYSTTPEQLEAFCEGVRELIRQHPYTRKDYYHVYVNEFAGSAINILLYCFLETPDWSTELRERHRLFLDIIRMAQRLGVEFAFPTQTVHLHHESTPPDTMPPQPAVPHLPEESAAFGRDAATAIVRQSLGENAEKPPPVTF